MGCGNSTCFKEPEPLDLQGERDCFQELLTYYKEARKPDGSKKFPWFSSLEEICLGRNNKSLIKFFVDNLIDTEDIDIQNTKEEFLYAGLYTIATSVIENQDSLCREREIFRKNSAFFNILKISTSYTIEIPRENTPRKEQDFLVSLLGESGLEMAKDYFDKYTYLMNRCTQPPGPFPRITDLVINPYEEDLMRAGTMLCRKELKRAKRMLRRRAEDIRSQERELGHRERISIEQESLETSSIQI